MDALHLRKIDHMQEIIFVKKISDINVPVHKIF